jgi:hypothetical protein
MATSKPLRTVLKRKEKRRMLFRIAIRGWVQAPPPAVIFPPFFDSIYSQTQQCRLIHCLTSISLSYILTSDLESVLELHSSSSGSLVSHLQTPALGQNSVAMAAATDDTLTKVSTDGLSALSQDIT